MTIALQMYTVRDECAKDFIATLKKVAEIGYPAVEMAGLYDLSPEAARDVLDAAGLKVAGSHEGYDALLNDRDAVISRNLALGADYIICPYAAGTDSDDPAVWDKIAADFNAIGQSCVDAGLGFGYHNHAHEFVQVNGEPGLARLFASTDPRLLKMEADVGWIWYAGVDPAEFIRKYPGRVPLIHAKDHDKADKKVNRPVGEGALDWKTILPAAADLGTQYAVVEEDVTVLPALESVARSYANLKGLLAG